MRKILPIIIAAIGCAAFIQARIHSGTFSKEALRKALSYKKQYTLSCSTNLALFNLDATAFVDSDIKVTSAVCYLIHASPVINVFW